VEENPRNSPGLGVTPERKFLQLKHLSRGKEEIQRDYLSSGERQGKVPKGIISGGENPWELNSLGGSREGKAISLPLMEYHLQRKIVPRIHSAPVLRRKGEKNSHRRVKENRKS